MIASNSRYLNTPQVTENINGTDILYLTPASPAAYTFQYSFYVVNGSDRIDNIAATFLGDPTQWFLIANANPEIMNWFNLTAGTIIRIPVVSVTS
jgi:nucleoid-associated protein YgaU